MTKPETRMTNQYPMIKCPNAQTKEFLGIKSLRHFFGFRVSDFKYIAWDL